LGKCATCRRKKKLGLQTKLTVNRPGDRHEREADRIAGRVMGSAPSPPSGIGKITPTVQREPGGSTSDVAPAAVHDVIDLPGHGLDAGTRSLMESRFGHNFSRVRIHTDARAAEAARSVNARAFTVGRDVVFGEGKYEPNSRPGQRLLAHELTHVLQQTGPAPFEFAPSGLVQRQPDDSGIPSPDAPTPSGPSTAVDRADRGCDIAALCRLKREHPGAVSETRIRSVTRRCRPGVTSSLSPCFNPAALMSPAELFGTLSPGTTPTPAPTSSPSSSGLNLSRFTKVSLNLGDTHIEADLPSSIRARLPITLRGALRLTFSLRAQTSGRFTFSMTLDGLRDIQIAATTTINAATQSGSANLTVRSTRRTCHAPNAQQVRASLTAAGNKLKDAINGFNAPIPDDSNAVVERASRIASVAGGIAEIHSAIERAQASCTQRPVVEAGIQSRFPLTQNSETAPFIGVGLTARF